MKIIYTLICAALLAVSSTAFSQTWNQVWADEFNGSIGPDWVFETGTGSGGWGNNELEYYRRENASIVNNQLQIQARRESFGGMAYTSARMKTQGRKSWKYGKIEARLSMPSFQGIWPAFWMLGDNIASVGWPACGEIDIMEHVNTGNTTYGTIHWADQNGAYAYYGGNQTSGAITAMHTYSIEWDASAIRWYFDGAKFHEANIANSINGTNEFHNNFFILLNLAVGGNWPGFTIDNNAFPANMLVDYVRVYQQGTNPNPGGIVSGATYSIINVNSNKAMEVSNFSTADGGNVQQWDYVGVASQKWRVTDVGAGSYSLINVNSGKCLDVSGVSTADGANIHQWAYVGGANQKWQIIANADGSYRILAAHSGKAAEVGGFSTANGGNVQQWAYVGAASQHWRFTQVAAARAIAETASTPETSVLQKQAFDVYPNPVANELNITTKDASSKIQIINSKGEVVFNGAALNGKIDASSLRPGIYTIHTIENGQRVSKRLVKQ